MYILVKTSSYSCKNRLQDAVYEMLAEHDRTVFHTKEEILVFQTSIEYQIELLNQEYKRCKPLSLSIWQHEISEPDMFIAVYDVVHFAFYHGKGVGTDVIAIDDVQKPTEMEALLSEVADSGEELSLFQNLEKLNRLDIEDSKGRVGACYSFISADKVQGGAKVSMGAPEAAIFNIISDKVIPILLLVNREAYTQSKKEVGND